MTKYYISDFTHVLEFDPADFGLQQDDEGVYTEDGDMFEWLSGLNKAIDFLESISIDTRALIVDEYEDYITMAISHGYDIL
ncbi:hypothetical protein [Ignavigranum ruoffiae]|uniref:hypothetical protein n=1 Tax=Ignavigranum ruoffiae TaxID=89093 RepID=UPI002355ADBD|nr:hypothetical protein [Ignavigranum ruoffiae]